ncbi:MAG: hypothetical protein K1X53_10560 [Candidatus Sumerlaeaceae bacterium]|nr:hypothetical protein [Candidatus Sumerlaeaceae bacterium]
MKNILARAGARLIMGLVVCQAGLPVVAAETTTAPAFPTKAFRVRAAAEVETFAFNGNGAALNGTTQTTCEAAGWYSREKVLGLFRLSGGEDEVFVARKAPLPATLEYWFRGNPRLFDSAMPVWPGHFTRMVSPYFTWVLLSEFARDKDIVSFRPREWPPGVPSIPDSRVLAKAYRGPDYWFYRYFETQMDAQGRLLTCRYYERTARDQDKKPKSDNPESQFLHSFRLDESQFTDYDLEFQLPRTLTITRWEVAGASPVRQMFQSINVKVTSLEWLPNNWSMPETIAENTKNLLPAATATASSTSAP